MFRSLGFALLNPTYKSQPKPRLLPGGKRVGWVEVRSSEAQRL